MRTVGIIGMGHVGATVAYTLFTHSMMDEDERRETLEEAGLDPDDYDEY